MKKLLLIALTFAAFILSQCKKDDYTNSENLFGTEWKTLDSYYGEYELLKFNSETEVTYVVKENPEDGGRLRNFGDGTYSISGNKIFINGESVFKFTGTIDGKVMNLLDDWENQMKFTKQ